jgi:hypothetical protein
VTFLTLTGRDVRTVAQARRLFCSARDRVHRRHPLTASVGVVHFAHGRAHVHALLVAPHPVPHRLARAQARAAGWGPIADLKPVLSGDASRVSIYVAKPLRGAHAWPKGGKQLRVATFSRSWGRGAQT